MSRRTTVTLLLVFVAMLVAACGNNDTKLKVTGIEPEKGDVEGGTYVRIKGNRFIADGARNAKVYFGSREGTVVRFASDSELIVEAPGGKPNETVDVLIIFEPGGELKIAKGFTFVEKNGATPSVDDLNIKKAK
ncbi:MAG: IPT/TIG domain-containing protein [Deltaproteobacteria bacterium]|nr:IPT/TIG domain-containing protein [Deltaproteobacteria bacterium]